MAKQSKVKTRALKNGVRQPEKDSISGRLWAICDNLSEKLGRPPARFEYREAVSKAKETYNHESVSYQYFQWRKHNGVKAHASGRYPSRGTFTVSKRTEAREAEAKPKKAVKKKTATKKAVDPKLYKLQQKAKAEKKAVKKATPKIISRAEAKKIKSKTYFTGKPCKNGHIAERSTGKGACLKCK